MIAAPTNEQVRRFRTLVASRLGLRFDEDRLGYLAEVLARRSEETTGAMDSYLSAVGAPGSTTELRALANELTVGETYFFRNAEQFRALADVALPSCARVHPWRRPLRILSAGCASGEEAYSLAILAREELERAGYPVSIHALDVNPAMLERAARRNYSPWSLRETPADLRSRYFRPAGRDLALDETLRDSVTFEERNLVLEDRAFWREGAFDVVFCRNVLMYFSAETAQAVVARIARGLVPGGYLFLGYAETMRGLSQDFHLCHTHGTFYYQRRDPKERTDPTQADGGFALRCRDERLAALDDHSSGAAIAGETSWIETIRRASERIESLTDGPSAGAGETAARPEGRRGGAVDLSRTIDLIRQERFAEAHASLASLPPETRRDPDVLLLRAILLTHGGDLVEAEALCRDALSLEEMSPGAHYVAALCREHAGDRAAAAEHDRVAAYLDPTFAMPRIHLGFLARRSGDQAAARRELSEALVLLEREDASRLLLYGGGFGRAGLLGMCRTELAACGGPL